MPPGRRSPVAGHPADRRTSSSPLNCGCGPAHGSGVLIDLDEPDVWVVEVLHDPIGVNERLSADILGHPDRPDVACRSSPVPDVAHGATNSDRTPESRPGQSGFARFGCASLRSSEPARPPFPGPSASCASYEHVLDGSPASLASSASCAQRLALGSTPPVRFITEASEPGK